MCTGGAVAAVYAVGMLRGRRDAYHRKALNLGLAVVLGLAPIQFLVGDFAARDVATTQPLKLAAMEAHYQTGSHVPLVVGGVYDTATHQVVGGIPIPDGLSLLLGFSPNTVVTGLDKAPADQQPLTQIVHPAFDTMVGLGTLILLTAAWGALRWWRSRRRGTSPRIPHTRPWLYAAALTGPAAMFAMLAGWEVTEGGRQPWIVYGQMLVSDAATKSTGLGWALLTTILIYLGLAVALVLILRKLATGAPPELSTPAPGTGGPDGSASGESASGEAASGESGSGGSVPDLISAGAPTDSHAANEPSPTADSLRTAASAADTQTTGAAS
jgi:cytochrome bd ubiquinol oxidase subunit I